MYSGMKSKLDPGVQSVSSQLSGGMQKSSEATEVILTSKRTHICSLVTKMGNYLIIVIIMIFKQAIIVVVSILISFKRCT